jgi:hypothetical protein
VSKIAVVEIRRLAAVGARARLTELKSEVAYLTKMFPELSPLGTGTPVGRARKGAKPGRKTPMSAAERKAVSRRMKKYWAARRANKNATS